MAIETPVLRQLFDQDTWTYTYLLFDPQTGEGVMIDPVKSQHGRDLKLIRELGVSLLYVLDTHVHADHITGAGLLSLATGAKIVLGAPSQVEAAHILVKEGELFSFGKHQIKALATPGHTDACTSFYLPGMLFSGDVLFIRGCGRTDFQQGSCYKMFDSITKKFYSLPDATLVYPGHDYKGQTVTTIGEEKQFNPRIPEGQTIEPFTEIMKNLNLPAPKYLEQSVPANLVCGFPEVARVVELPEGVSMDGLHGLLPELSPGEVVVDVRTLPEFAAGHVPGAINIPQGTEQLALDQLKTYSKIYLYCRSGHRIKSTYANLAQNGVTNLVPVTNSGMPDWISAGYPVSLGINP